MATTAYCDHVGPELQVWSNKLHTLSGKIDKISSIEKQQLFSQIEELHMIITELDDRITSLTSSCSLADESLEEEDRYPSSSKGANANLEKGANFDYDFGG